MKLTLNIRDYLYWAIIGLLLWLQFRNTTPDISPEITKLTFQRDSILSAKVKESELISANYHRLADSCRDYVKNYVSADSINKFKNRHEKAKIKKLTPSQRDYVRDSILRANGIPTSTR